MAVFSKYFKMLMAHEGGYVDDPDDAGGATKYGITFAVWEEEGYDKDGDGKITKNDVRLITVDDAEKIAKRNYWDKVKGDLINNQSIAEFVFDWAYNSGVSAASKRLQVVLGVKADGVIGPVTISKLNAANQRDVFNKLKQSRLSFVQAIVRSKPSQAKYLNGWKNRINSFNFVA